MKTLKLRNLRTVVLIILILSVNSFAAFAAEDDVIDLHGTDPNPPAQIAATVVANQ